MAGKPHYFPFFPKDFAADSAVEAMSTLEVGAYILLICKAWDQEPPGSIPNDDQTLARWARLSAAEWADAKPRVLAAFKPDASGRLYQKRLRQEWDRLQERLASASRAGKKSGEVRRAMKGGELNDCSTDVERTFEAPLNGKPTRAFGFGFSEEGKPTEGETITAGGGAGGAKVGKFGWETAPGFDAFWAVYPNHDGRDAALQRWRAVMFEVPVAEHDAFQATILAAVRKRAATEKWRESGGKYVPKAARWLAEKGWLDDVREVGAAAESQDERAERIRRKREAFAKMGRE